jgi:hypothetical protein
VASGELRTMRGVGFRFGSEIESSPRAFRQPMMGGRCLLVPVDAEASLAAHRSLSSRLLLGVQSEAAASVRSFAATCPTRRRAPAQLTRQGVPTRSHLPAI